MNVPHGGILLRIQHELAFQRLHDETAGGMAD
jgi:hypothetical protein